MGIGAVIVGFITKKMLMSKIINKIYLIRHYNAIGQINPKSSYSVDFDNDEKNSKLDLEDNPSRRKGANSK
jgi:hypothetical protein